MKRLTTDTPKDNLEAALNLFYIKDHETWVRGGGPGPEYADVSLFNFIRDVVKTHIPDVELPEDNDDLSNMMPEWLMDGIDSAEGVVALLYTAAWAYAELRHKLMRYENAEQDGRLVVWGSCDYCYYNDDRSYCPDGSDSLDCGVECFGCVCGECEGVSKFKPKVALAWKGGSNE